MIKDFELQIVTPERTQGRFQVSQVIIPTLAGDVGVLAQHAPLLTALERGVVSVYQKGALSDRIFIIGGFGEVSHNRCVLLVTEAVSVRSFVAEDLEVEIKNLREQWAQTHSDEIVEKIALTQAKLDALTLYYH